MHFEPQHKIIAQSAEKPTLDFVVVPTCCGLVILDHYQFEANSSASSIEEFRKAERSSLMTFVRKQLLRPTIMLLMIAATITAASS